MSDINVEYCLGSNALQAKLKREIEIYIRRTV